jgi:hypothetical protein
MERRGGRAELRLQSLAITFPDGYVAPVDGPITLESDEGYALKDPGKGRIISTIAMPLAGLGIGALIGHSVAGGPQTLTTSLPAGCTGQPPYCLTSSLPDNSNVLKSTAIGSMAGLAIGGIAAVAVVFGTRNFYLDAGSPVSMVLHQPVTMPEDEVEEAIREAEEHEGPQEPVMLWPRPIVPPTMNNGTCFTPGTPAVGDFPGTPSTAYPCP